MKPKEYKDMGIPEGYLFESFAYVPAANTGICVFTRKEEPEVSRIFWRRADQDTYTMIPVANDHYSFDSCRPSPSSAWVYYSVMHHKRPEGMKHFGGYWESLNRFCLSSLKEEVLITEKEFAGMTGKYESWISKILHISSDESEIDVVAGLDYPINEHLVSMEYAVYRINLVSRQITLRMSMPAAFI